MVLVVCLLRYSSTQTLTLWDELYELLSVKELSTIAHSIPS